MPARFRVGYADRSGNTYDIGYADHLDTANAIGRIHEQHLIKELGRGNYALFITDMDNPERGSLWGTLSEEYDDDDEPTGCADCERSYGPGAECKCYV